MQEFNLVQRGFFASKYEEGAALTGCRGVVSLDSMYSPEFRGAAIPKSFRRIMSNYDYYEVFGTGIVSARGKELKIFCHRNMEKRLIAALKEFIWFGWETKEELYLNVALFDTNLVNAKKVPNFWWCVDFPQEANLYDWMAFFAPDEDTFSAAIMNDFKTWWMEMSEKERAREYKRSLC